MYGEQRLNPNIIQDAMAKKLVKPILEKRDGSPGRVKQAA
jgi:hypothetical protein